MFLVATETLESTIAVIIIQPSMPLTASNEEENQNILAFMKEERSIKTDDLHGLGTDIILMGSSDHLIGNIITCGEEPWKIHASLFGIFILDFLILLDFWFLIPTQV